MCYTILDQPGMTNQNDERLLKCVCVVSRGGHTKEIVSYEDLSQAWISKCSLYVELRNVTMFDKGRPVCIWSTGVFLFNIYADDMVSK